MAERLAHTQGKWTLQQNWTCQGTVEDGGGVHEPPSRLTSTIDFHDTLNGFCDGQVTGTTSLKDKILHQMTPIREEFLYEIFLGLHNVYDALD